MCQELPFDPFPFMQNPHFQTVAGAALNSCFEPLSTTRLVPMQDGDRISLEVTTPAQWKPTDPTVFFVHGLCSSHRAPILARMAKRLEPLGIRTVRFNMRGCGSGRGLSKHIYHSGSSDDVFACLTVLKKEHPDSQVLLIGISLGGNVVLKLAGELGDLSDHFIKGVVAIGPPVDLHRCIEILGEPENAFYESYFYRNLRADVHYRHELFKDLGPIDLPRNLKLYEFDQIYVAPKFKFRNAQDYYNKCSSIYFIPEIQSPCKILFSEDDPIIPSTSFDDKHLPSNVSLFKTKKGGHIGYLGKWGSRGFYWIDSLLQDWILELLLSASDHGSQA